jgi:GMP synthase (glutamine-hydrolysing)
VTGSTVLVVQHQDDCPPALFGTWLVEAGCVLDVRRPYAGDGLPDDLAGHHGLLVLGGSMGAYDDAEHRWLGATKALVRTAARDAVPTLGICLGHQLAAVALGGTVEVNEHGRQFGVLPVGWTEATADDPVLGSRPARVIHWNNDVVTTPPTGATRLATAPDGTVQAARLATTVWGVQAHPEVDDAIVARWAADERDEIGPDIVDRAVAEMSAAGPDLARWWRPVASAFAGLVAGHSASVANQPDGPTAVPIRGTYWSK